MGFITNFFNRREAKELVKDAQFKWNAQRYARSDDEYQHLLDGAWALVEKAIKKDPTYANAYLLRGFINRNRGHDKEALDDLIKAQQFSVDDAIDDVVLHDTLASLKAEKKQYAEAINDMNRAIETAEGCGIEPKYKYYFKRGIIKKIAEEYDDAMEDYNTAIQMAPKKMKAEILSYRAVLKLNMNKKNSDWIMSDLDEAIELDPDYAQAYVNRAHVKRDLLGDILGATNDINRAIEIDPHLKDALKLRANIRYELGDYEGTLNDFDRIKRSEKKETKV